MRDKTRWHNIKMIALLSILILTFVLTGCAKVNHIVHVENTKSGDAKFLSDNTIMGGEGGFLFFYRFDNRKKTMSDIRSNWSDRLPEENIVVVSDSDCETRICKTDANQRIVWVHPLFSKDCDLRIDPAIVKIDKTYYLTSTRINGEINRADPAKENGAYALSLYRSNDLMNWTYVRDIVNEKSNIEDIDLMNDDGKLRVTFERETVDKGASAIVTMVSPDGGSTWGEPVTLVDDGSDNEPASLMKTDSGYRLFFSSDAMRKGESYQGSSAYVTSFDPAFKPVKTDRLITKPESGVLLYDVIVKNDSVKLLFAENYLTDNNLIAENVPLP